MSHDLIEVWLKFAACAVLIGAAGWVLTRSGDVIAAKTGMSRSWVGLILLASATSLPELATGASAVTIARAPNIAVGDVFGSCVLNLVLLVVLDALSRRESVYRRTAQGHILSAAFGIVLIGFAGVSLLLREHGLDFSIGHVGIYTPVIIVMYLVAVRSIFVYERRVHAALEQVVEDRYPGASLRRAILLYAASALVVAGAGAWLPFIATDLAALMGWHNTFVGTIFVAAATSMPEVAVTIAALRLGSVDLAFGNLLGSNLFDIFILGIDDILYLDGPILSHVSSAHAVSALSAVIMSGIVVIGVLYRPKARLFRAVGWISLALFIVYLLNAYVLYLRGG